MRALTVEQGPVTTRSIAFSEESVRLAGLIAELRQLSVAPLVKRAAQDLAASVVLPELDGRTSQVRSDQRSTISSVLEVLGQRAATLERAADDVIAIPPPTETTYTPISAADAVIRYAGNFVPSWAGAIAIDLLPMVLVLIVAVTQSAIRSGRSQLGIEHRMTVAEMRAAVAAAREVDEEFDSAHRPISRGSETEWRYVAPKDRPENRQGKAATVNRKDIPADTAEPFEVTDQEKTTEAKSE